MLGPGGLGRKWDDAPTYASNITEALQVLKDCQEEIRQNGLIKYKGTAMFKYLTAFLTLLAILVSIWFNCRSDDETDVSGNLMQLDSGFVTMHVDKGQAELTRKALENWLQDNDETVTKRQDSMMGDWNSRGMHQSGMAKTELARFRDSCHRRRDYVIDSFYHAYSLQGGDTTKLKHRRSLP